MKKFAVILAIVVACLVCYIAGRAEGIRHAIEDSEVWAVERYNPDEPEESAWGEYDQRIFITVDGETYVHGLTQG